jgi:hypothetical protein
MIAEGSKMIEVLPSSSEGICFFKQSYVATSKSKLRRLHNYGNIHKEKKDMVTIHQYKRIEMKTDHTHTV